MLFRESDRQLLKSIFEQNTAILTKLDTLIGQQQGEMMTLAELKTQVEKNTAVEESAVTLIQGLAAQIAAAKTDPAAVQALADELTKSGADLAAAIAANTPAAPSA